MRFLVVGGGGREHALGWKLAGEGHEVGFAPGNPGCGLVGEVFGVGVNDRRGLLELAGRFGPDVVLVGPEDPLIAGLGDMFREHGFAVFGPGAGAARLEGSKAFAKDLMKRAGVPTAEHQVFSDPGAAGDYIERRFGEGRPVVVKASGAALGKGVVVCETASEGVEAARSMLVDLVFGEAGRTVVVEDRILGREFSLLTLVSEGEILSLPVAQDHKRLLAGDLGPNTGGMGTFSPVGWVSSGLVAEVEERVVRPILGSLRDLGIGYRGVLFSGLMVEDGRPYCLEYNVRFGDPETQSVVRRLGSGFGSALAACAAGGEIPAVEVLENVAVTVVVAASGYPGGVEKGAEVSLGAMPEGVEVFHAGTALAGERLVASGGRVLGVSAVGGDLAEARGRAYAGVEAVGLAGKVFRGDIGG